MSGRPGSMTQDKRDRLMNIQKREQLKGMLINKFKVKYGDKPQISKYIDNEVARFLKNERLTEVNLQGLDTKINKEAELRDKKEDVLSQRSGSQASKRAASNFDGKSVASQRSAASGVKSNRSASQGRAGDNMSVASSVRSKATDIYSEINEEDEWFAIQKFNTLLHYEEQKQALMRERERKRLIREELDRQIVDKAANKEAGILENRQYDKMQAEHVALLGARETVKIQEYKAKVLLEKESRDRQLKLEKQRFRVQKKADYVQDQELVIRLQQEMEAERQMMTDKREQEKVYLKKMIEDNNVEKFRKDQEDSKQRDADILAQQQYCELMDKQEKDRQNEFQKRENRAQEFMNRMASTVIAQQNQRQATEDANIQKYEMEKEMRMRIEDEKKKELIQKRKSEMRSYLNNQVAEKKVRDGKEKSLNDEQAGMWSNDRALYEAEETRLNEKIKKINAQNADFLSRQMADKKLRSGNSGMNKAENQYNKPLLRVINDKRKE